MTLNSGFLIAFLLSLMGILMTAIDIPDWVKYTLSGMAAILTFPALLINVIVFLRSPFDRKRHLTNELWKALYADSFQNSMRQWSLDGRATYCNQSLFPKTLLSDRPYLCFVGDDPVGNNCESFFMETKITKNFTFTMLDNIRKNYDVDYTCHLGLSYSAPKDVMNAMVSFSSNFKINELSCELFWNRFDGELILKMSYLGMSQNVLKVDCNLDSAMMMGFILSFHENHPYTGLCKVGKKIRGSCRFHSYSYQDILGMIGRPLVELVSKTCMSNFTVEGIDEDAEDYSMVKNPCLYKKFGPNMKEIIKHNLLFWGRLNTPALNYISKNRSGRGYSKIGPNWKSKRYLVDVSYLLELMGSTRLSNIELGVKPTVFCNEVKDKIVKYENGSYLYSKDSSVDYKEKVEILKENLRSGMKYDRELVRSTKLMAGEMKVRSKSDIEFIKKSSIILKKTDDIKPNPSKRIGISDYKPKSNTVGMRVKIGEKFIKDDFESAKKMLDERNPSYKDKLMSTFGSILDSNLKSLKSIDIGDFIFCMNDSNKSQGKKYRSLEQLKGYDGGINNFTLKWERSKSSERKRNLKLDRLYGFNDPCSAMRKSGVRVSRCEKSLSLVNYYQVLMTVEEEYLENMEAKSKCGGVSIESVWKRKKRYRKKSEKRAIRAEKRKALKFGVKKLNSKRKRSEEMNTPNPVNKKRRITRRKTKKKVKGKWSRPLGKESFLVRTLKRLKMEKYLKEKAEEEEKRREEEKLRLKMIEEEEIRIREDIERSIMEEEERKRLLEESKLKKARMMIRKEENEKKRLEELEKDNIKCNEAYEEFCKRDLNILISGSLERMGYINCGDVIEKNNIGKTKFLKLKTVERMDNSLLSWVQRNYKKMFNYSE